MSIPTGNEYMRGRRQHVLEIHDKIERAEAKDDQDKVDDLRQELDEMPLEIRRVWHVEVVLGVGGPTDWLDVEMSDGGGVRSVTYFYVWGSESYRTSLAESDALYQYAERIAESYADYD